MLGAAGDSAMHRVRREFSSDLNELAELRRVAVEACRTAWGESGCGEAIEQIELALQEAATNIVRHAYSGEKGGVIVLEVEANGDICRLTLTHRGRDFDPAQVAPPDFDGNRFGGFGQYLIGQCVDEVRYIHGDGQAGVHLVKRRTPRAAGKKRMNMLTESFGDVAVVTLTEEQLDASNADDFRQSLAPVLADFHKVVLDLGRLQFVDSRGCGAILSCLKATTEAGGDLHLCSVTRPVRTVFDFIRLHRICDIFDTKEQAVAAFKNKAEGKK
jgi:anti-sigma B factor antagonist